MIWPNSLPVPPSAEAQQIFNEVFSLYTRKALQEPHEQVDAIAWLKRDTFYSPGDAKYQEACEMLRKRSGMACKVISKADPPSGPYWTGVYVNWNSNPFLRYTKTWYYTPDLFTLWPSYGQGQTIVQQDGIRES